MTSGEAEEKEPDERHDEEPEGEERKGGKGGHGCAAKYEEEGEGEGEDLDEVTEESGADEADAQQRKCDAEEAKGDGAEVCLSWWHDDSLLKMWRRRRGGFVSAEQGLVRRGRAGGSEKV